MRLLLLLITCSSLASGCAGRKPLPVLDSYELAPLPGSACYGLRFPDTNLKFHTVPVGDITAPKDPVCFDADKFKAFDEACHYR